MARQDLGLLFVVGEERNSAGALAAAKTPRGARYIICGEPTENKLAVGSKGVLRYQITSRGRMAHSAYPELGESAIEKLLDVLSDLRRHANAGGSTARRFHAQYRHDRRRPSAECHSGLRKS